MTCDEGYNIWDQLIASPTTLSLQGATWFRYNYVEHQPQTNSQYNKQYQSLEHAHYTILWNTHKLNQYTKLLLLEWITNQKNKCKNQEWGLNGQWYIFFS